MTKNYSFQSGYTKAASVIFFILVCLSLLSPIWVFRDLLFPYVTSKAFYFRICLELALPFYVFLLVVRPELRPKWKRQYLNWAMVLFMLLNFVSAVIGPVPMRSIWGNFERMGGAYYIAHLTLLYFYALMLAQMGGNFLKRFLQFFLLAAGFVTINGIFGKLGLPTVVLDPSLPYRMSSTLGNPIYVGSFLVVPIFLALFFGRQAEGKVKEYAYYFLAFLFLLAVIFSATRGASVGLIVGSFLAAVIYVIFTKNRRTKLVSGGIVLFFVIIFGILFAFNSKLPAGEFQRLFHLNDTNASARWVQWGVALDGFKEHPLLGVGPENYYLIANKYYNPAIFQFDRSWFDKPHNYWIEVLVTNGALGFAVYLSVLILVGLAFYRGFKTGFLSLMEFSILLAALLAYQIQNLTVFDTVPASLAFYCLVGLAGFIWDASASLPEKVTAKNKSKRMDPIFSGAAFGISSVVVIYLIYATNIVPMEAAKAVNYGYAYASVNQAVADQYFQRAISLPFNFDKTQTAQKYGEFAMSLERSATAAQQDIVKQVSDHAIAALNDALAIEPGYPILWQELSQVYLFQNLKNGRLTSVNPNAEYAINRAIALAPKREEPQLALVQIKASEGDLLGSIKLLENLEAEFPLDSNLPGQLAMLYNLQGNTEAAVTSMEKAIKMGYNFSSASEEQWLVNYYANKQKYNEALTLELKAQTLEPNNVEVLTTLVKLYGITGQVDMAVKIANAISQSDPSKTQAMQALIDSIYKNATTTK